MRRDEEQGEPAGGGSGMMASQGNYQPPPGVSKVEAGAASDAQLIEETLGGDSAAFGSLVTRYQDRLYRMMVHVVGSIEEAEDVVQEAFVQAFVRLETFQQRSAFFTWLYRIAFNTAVSHKRRRKWAHWQGDGTPRGRNEPPDRVGPPVELVLRQEQMDQVRSAIASLSAEHRSVLVLRELEGCSYDAISEILGLPVGTVRSRIHRARMQLREQLKGLLVEESETSTDRERP